MANPKATMIVAHVEVTFVSWLSQASVFAVFNSLVVAFMPESPDQAVLLLTTTTDGQKDYYALCIPCTRG